MTSNAATLTVTPATLVSIQITPAMTSKAAGLTQPVHGHGHVQRRQHAQHHRLGGMAFERRGRATIAAGGLASTLAVGSAHITASLDGVTSGAATLTVTPATLVAIQITPATASKAVGLTQQYTATGTYSDAVTTDITRSVSWTRATQARPPSAPAARPPRSPRAWSTSLPRSTA